MHSCKKKKKKLGGRDNTLKAYKRKLNKAGFFLGGPGR